MVAYPNPPINMINSSHTITTSKVSMNTRRKDAIHISESYPLSTFALNAFSTKYMTQVNFAVNFAMKF